MQKVKVRCFKKSLTFYAVLLVLIFTLSCASPNREEYAKKEYFENSYSIEEINSVVSQMDAKYPTPGFKGLHLGMTRDDVNYLIKVTPWKYAFESREKANAPSFKNDEWLKGEYYRGGLDWDTIGCYGREGKTYCHHMDGVKLKYLRDKVVYISLDGISLSADEIKRRVKDWGEFALNGLTQKYGPPTAIKKDITKIGIFDFETGYKVLAYRWVLGEDQIDLTIDAARSMYSCSVVFENIAAMKDVRKEEKSGKSSF